MKRVVSVKCSNGIVFCDAKDYDINKGTFIILDSPSGLILSKTLSDVKEEDEKNLPDSLANIIRIATDKDIEQQNKNDEESKNAIIKANKISKDLKLSMKIIDAYYSLDKSQLLFIFTADGRIDFRELAKKLAQIYKTRIELRQIGVRDNAKRIGGIGPCGRFLCCSTFLTDFDSVSINMAKNQYIALNPTKINGVCGRLLCCLKYEDDQYTELKKNMPKIGQVIEVGGTTGKVTSINLFLNTAVLETKNKIFVEVNLGDKYGSIK